MSRFGQKLLSYCCIFLLTGFSMLCSLPLLAKESVITRASSYVIQGDPINVDAVAIKEALSAEKPLTLLVYVFESRRWVSLGSSHSDRAPGFAQVTGNRVLFTVTDSESLAPGSTYFGTSRSCTANGICPLDVEPDEARRVIIVRQPELQKSTPAIAPRQ